MTNRQTETTHKQLTTVSVGFNCAVFNLHLWT